VGRPVSLPGFGTVVSLPSVPDPAHPLHISLDGGVYMSIPIAMYTSESTIPEVQRTPHPARTSEPMPASDRATRLADVALASSLLEHFYPYFDVVHSDWIAARKTALRSAAADSDATSFRATLERMIAQLHDGHGNVVQANMVAAVPDVRLGWA